MSVWCLILSRLCMVGFLSILRPAVTGDDALRVVRGTQNSKVEARQPNNEPEVNKYKL